MPRRLFIPAILAFLLVAAPPMAWAETGGASPPDRNDMARFTSEYTETMLLGVIGGGVLMNSLIGGGGPTLAGALAGSTLASWLFVALQARHYVVQRAAPHGAR